MSATRTDWLTVNGVNVRLRIVHEIVGGDTLECVIIEAEGGANLEGIEPGMYIPTPAK